MKSQLTTLCYIEENGKYLMLHRTKKDNDENHDKWIGVGGHFEKGESPEDCLVREVKEETGLTLHSFDFRGIVTFVSDENPAEYMCLFTSKDFSGEIISCNEGQLEWVNKSEVTNLNLWEGDKLFLELLTKDVPFFSMKLVYKNGRLVEKYLDGKAI
ncbi:MAG: 8-oxo-dGTP diphosphatase [Treponema sp.]|nr:8-oxo-dGTP diphosphatase [Treponema sp.]